MSNRSGRFEASSREAFDDGWESLADEPAITTEVKEEPARHIITTNQSPDIGFSRSINPYRGCEHGCIYCYARPSHCYLGHSAGLDFESRLYAKTGAAELLRAELARPGYVPEPIVLGTNTDPYQPIERRFGITRRVLEVFEETGHPVAIVSKSALVLRDKVILARLAERGLVRVALSITTLDRRLARKMEPRAATPARRLAALSELSTAGIPTTVLVAPVIPALNDHEIEAILEAAKEAGAGAAGMIVIRLPQEVRALFHEWLLEAFPDRARRVISLIRSMRGGADYESAWHTRQRGRGPYAAQLWARFERARRRLGLTDDALALRSDLFRPPGRDESQRRDRPPNRDGPPECDGPTGRDRRPRRADGAAQLELFE